MASRTVLKNKENHYFTLYIVSARGHLSPCAWEEPTMALRRRTGHTDLATPGVDAGHPDTRTSHGKSHSFPAIKVFAEEFTMQ